MSATHGPLSSTSALARHPAVCACALGSAGSRSSDRRRVKSEPPPVPAGEPHEGANYRSFYWGMENPLFGICSPSSRERRSESPQKNGGHSPLSVELFSGLPEAVGEQRADSQQKMAGIAPCFLTYLVDSQTQSCLGLEML